MILQYCEACTVRITEHNAVAVDGKVYCRTCAEQRGLFRPTPIAVATPRTRRGSSAVRLPAAAAVRRTPISGIRLPIQPGQQRAPPAPGSTPATVASQRGANPPPASRALTWGLSGMGALLAILGVYLLARGDPSAPVAAPAVVEKETGRPQNPSALAPAAQPPASGSHSTSADAGTQAPAVGQQRAPEPNAAPKSVFLVTEMEDIREGSAQRELDGLVQQEKSGKLNPFELRMRYERLVSSRGSTKAGKTAAEKLKTLPVLRNEANLALRKPVTVSSSEGSRAGPFAVDGNAGLDSAWWAGPAPQWLTVDLEQVCSVATIHFFPYWGDGRFYQYTIELSKDNQAWQTVVDQTANTRPSVPDGNVYCFPPAEARYVRVTMLKNNINPSVHIVELKVFPP